jgi:hypothetical protein
MAKPVEGWEDSGFLVAKLWLGNGNRKLQLPVVVWKRELPTQRYQALAW